VHKASERDPLLEPDREDAQAAQSIGLCARCRHARRATNARGSAFWQCLRARSDSRFRRYPPLPVRTCPGYEAEDASSSEDLP
jgi:hypothetical protein